VFHKTVVITDADRARPAAPAHDLQFDHEPGVVKRSMRTPPSSRRRIDDATSKVVVSTMQKYPFILNKDRRGVCRAAATP
jgi:type I restriction enzyme R subunit